MFTIEQKGVEKYCMITVFKMERTYYFVVFVLFFFCTCSKTEIKSIVNSIHDVLTIENLWPSGITTELENLSEKDGLYVNPVGVAW